MIYSFMKYKGTLIGGIIGILIFIVLNYFDLNLVYLLFNSFDYGLGQDKFITIGFIALGLSLIFWILIGALVGWFVEKRKR